MADTDQIVVSRELLGLMRRAVAYAVEAGAEFVGAQHLLLAILDDEHMGAPLGEVIERERVQAMQPRTVEPDLKDDVDDEPAPVYRSLMFRSPDGKDGRWLDAETFRMFLEGARRVPDGPYLPKHLALGYLTESSRTRELLQVFGPKLPDIQAAVYAL